MTIRFDESLGKLAQTVLSILGPDRFRKSVAIREPAGRLSIIVDDEIEQATLDRAATALLSALGSYARTDRVIADRNAIGARPVLDDPHARDTPINSEGLSIRLLDRRIVGTDWMEVPDANEVRPPRIVFASLKGGVGRSTALSILAADQARRGRNVLALDLDLEAPGVGSMLLGDDRRPRYGMTDFLVENGIGGITDEELNEFVGTSSLTTGAGLVDIVPATGKASVDYPRNYLAKLSRASLEDITSEGSVSVRAQVREAVDRLANRRSYDLVLVDSRAGLAELSAGPLLALGATVLLFGTPDKQTIEGYRYLLAALANLIPLDINVRESDLRWRERLKIVMAKGSLDTEIISWFVSEMHDIFTDYLYDEVEGLEGFSFDVEDQDGPHFPIVIPFDPRFAQWDPSRQPHALAEAFYQNTFGPFVEKIDTLVEVRDDIKG